MKKRMRKAGILLVVFVAAIFVSSLFMNSGVDDQIIDLGDPTLPRISFQKEGRTVNALAGYVNEMDVTAMRDTITPLEANGTLQMQIEEFGNKITGVEYKVYSTGMERKPIWKANRRIFLMRRFCWICKKVFRMKFQKLFWK